MASPFIFSHSPICLKRSSNMGIILPSLVGPTFSSKLPPQLCKNNESIAMSFPKYSTYFSFVDFLYLSIYLRDVDCREKQITLLTKSEVFSSKCASLFFPLNSSRRNHSLLSIQIKKIKAKNKGILILDLPNS